MRTLATLLLISVLGAFTAAATPAQTPDSAELPPGSAQLISPEDLVKVLQSSGGAKPVILNVGPSLLYQQAHIPGSDYVGSGSEAAGLERLRARVRPLPHGTFIVLYCGCCPWSHCPNVRPAYDELHELGFNNVKVLFIANNFGTDWVDKGYPTIKGQ
jgi:thiosulfate/3-mercaptopyruvate sulfurtransferase